MNLRPHGKVSPEILFHLTSVLVTQKNTMTKGLCFSGALGWFAPKINLQFFFLSVFRPHEEDNIIPTNFVFWYGSAISLIFFWGGLFELSAQINISLLLRVSFFCFVFVFVVGLFFFCFVFLVGGLLFVLILTFHLSKATTKI